MKLVKEASEYIKKQLTVTPEIGLVLGSGLGDIADQIKNKITISYSDIPHFPKSTVEGHAGQFVVGTLNEKIVIAMQGRFHYYEGYSMKQVTLPIIVMKELGIHSIIVTNAAGGVNEDFKPGDFMIITDHINNMGVNPLIGPNEPKLGDRFPDMSETYDKKYIKHAKNCAKELSIQVQKGVYVGNSGPTYETPAEVRMLRIVGSDAVGMSTVPEVIMANYLGLRILGISCISNMAAGILNESLSHKDVIETTEKVKKEFSQLIKKIVHTLPN